MTVLTREEVASDIRSLAAYAGEVESPDIRTTYATSLNNVQPQPVRFRPGDPRPTLTFEIEDPRTRAILDSLMRAEDMVGVERVAEIDTGRRPAVVAGIDDGLALLEGVDPEASEIVRALVAEIVIVDAHGFAAGSFWQTLGMIWMSPTESWTASQYAETLLHEGTHQAMFLHDMVTRLFSRPEADLGSPEGLVTSPIRRVPRPYDASFHAAVVSATLIDFFERAGDATTARAMVRPLIQTVSELSEKSFLLTASGQQILDRVVAGVGASEAFAAESAAALV
jgi:HEXXH motif-containing protein